MKPRKALFRARSLKLGRFSRAMRYHLPAILLLFAAVGCQAQPLRPGSEADELQSLDVPTMPLREAVSPPLTSGQIESLRLRLSKLTVEKIADLEAALPVGSRFMPASYDYFTTKENGRWIPYTRTIWVCRLSKDRDIVVVTDNRSGGDVVRKWFIRDLARFLIAEAHVAILRKQLASDTKLRHVHVVVNNSGGSIRAVGEVRTDADLRDLKVVVDATKPPVPVSYGVKVLEQKE